MPEVSELTIDQQVASTNEGLKASVEAGTYLITDNNIEHLAELGVPLTPLEAINLKIQAREKYATVVSEWEMLSNKGFKDELEGLKNQQEELQKSEQKPSA
jgi:hypothetical protein